MTKRIYTYHYVYRISNILLHKHYYGVRSTNRSPIDDLGKKYFSSSTDRQFISDQKENPSNYKYKIVKVFETRLEAIAHEIFLHERFNVAINPSFYNRSKQKIAGFDRTGMSPWMKGKTHSDETKLKIGQKSKGRLLGDKNPMYGKTQPEEIKKEHSLRMKGRYIGVNNPFYGKEHSEETKMKMRKPKKNTDKMKGIPRSENHKQKLREARKNQQLIYVSRIEDRRVFDLGNYMKWIRKTYPDLIEI